jgi:hypothetical protein
VLGCISTLSAHYKYNSMLRSLVILVIVRLVYNVHCFTSISTCTRGRQHHHHHHEQSSTVVLYSQIYVVSLEGVVLDMVDWRSQQGIQVALDTWPHLYEYDLVGDNQEWLQNKVKALAHVLARRTGLSPTCDYALLTRLLLEEQSLDQGHSTNSTGKYASRFHPSSSSDSNARQETIGTRPLTVGEIEANWCDGASLSETLMTHYSVSGNHPLAVLQTCREKEASVPSSKVLYATLCKIDYSHYVHSSSSHYFSNPPVYF